MKEERWREREGGREDREKEDKGERKKWERRLKGRELREKGNM